MKVYFLTPFGNSGWELSIDPGQWMIGFNGGTLFANTKYFNIFLGPFRLGWYSDK